MLVNHGSESKYLHTHLGLNSRLDAIQAAVLRIKLKHIRRWTEDRRRHADYYRKVLGDCSEVVLPIEKDGAHHVYHLFVVRVPGDRDAVLKELNRLGVGAGIHYPIPLHLQPVFAELGYGKGDFPETERAAESIISLPMYPEMTTEQMDFVAQSLRDVIKAKA